jgi:DNA-binding GntR family transcriptional regulator
MENTSRISVRSWTVKAGADHSVTGGMTSRRPALTGQPSAWALPDSLADRTYQYLEQDITTLRIPPGTVLSEALLSKQFGIDRTPVRDALQRLAREGLVVITPRRRLMVPELDAATQLRLLPVRQELERLLVREVARCAVGET